MVLFVASPFTRYIRVGNKSFIIRPPLTPEEHAELMEVERRIWGGDYRDVVPYHVTIPLLDAGGVVWGIYEVGTGKPVGVLVMFLGVKDGKIYFHSHMLGFLSEYRGKGLGTAVKKLQREEALARGVDLIIWTYDPLLLSNAWINIVKMGVIVREYRPNYYGVGTFNYNRGVETDRFIVEWHLKSKRVVERLTSGGKHQTLNHYLDGVGAEVVLEEEEALSEGFSIPVKRNLLSRSEVVLVAVPKDFVGLLSKSPDIARKWRLESRVVLNHYIKRKYVVVDIATDSSKYYYVLWREGLDKALEGELP